jgi:phosphatidylserine/phosphatidylglycerophosphate/cardiolipin synthase-like enzyme
VVAAVVLWAAPAALAAPTPYLDAVAAQLRARAPGTENRIWWISQGNTLPQGWLLQTPDCWGNVTCGQPPPGGQRFLNATTGMIANAKRSVDIADLYPPPGGQFQTAIVNGLVQALKKGSNLQVRVLIGTYPSSFIFTTFTTGLVTAGAYANDLENAVKRGLAGSPGAGKLSLNVAYIETDFLVKVFGVGVADSWNHEKVIDTDGREAIVGGMNYWAFDYLNLSVPVNDLSMEVAGPAATDVSRYDDVLWSWTCSHNKHPYVTLVTVNAGCISQASTVPAVPAAGTVPIIVVGHLGNGMPVPGAPNGQSPPIPAVPVSGNNCSLLRSPTEGNDSRSYEYRNPGEDALRALIASAKRSIFISQQDMLSCLPKPIIATESKFDDRLFAILGTKIAQKVPINIVVSPKSAKAGDYSNGYTLQDIASVLKEVVAKQQRVSAAQARLLVCADVGLSTVHSRAAATWPDGKPFRNHAKLVAVDGQAFYIGSENLYPARLQELGLIVEDTPAAAQLYSQYIDPLWKYSAPYALTNPATKTCGSF